MPINAPHFVGYRNALYASNNEPDRLINNFFFRFGARFVHNKKQSKRHNNNNNKTNVRNKFIKYIKGLGVVKSRDTEPNTYTKHGGGKQKRYSPNLSRIKTDTAKELNKQQHGNTISELHGKMVQRNQILFSILFLLLFVAKQMN